MPNQEPTVRCASCGGMLKRDMSRGAWVHEFAGRCQLGDPRPNDLKAWRLWRRIEST